MALPPAKVSRVDSLGALAAAVIVVVFCLLLLRHDRDFFWADDYQISILPVFADVARSWSEGQWPLLSPYSWVCSNLAGEFQYGTFSVFVNAAVVCIWKFALTFSQQAAALSIVHLVALAGGAYLLARGRALAMPLALLVATVAALNGWMICWGASDWFGALAAFTWLPWSWWALEKAVRADGPRWRVLLPGPFIYLLIAGGFPYTILMLGLITGWLFLHALAQRRDWLALVRLATGWVIGLGLSAPAWIALLDYAPGSRRSVEIFRPRQWLVPLSGLPGLILPSWTVQWRTFEETLLSHAAVELACGLAPAVILFALLATRKTKLLRAIGWELVLLAVVLCVCLVPSASIFRFSFRWLALFHLVLALTAAEALQRWNEARGGRRDWLHGNPGAWATLLVGAAWIAMVSFGLTSPKQTALLPATFLAASVIWWIGDALLSRAHAAWLPLGVAFVTLWSTYTTLNPHAPVARYFFSGDLNRVAPLDPERLYLSLYPTPQAYYRADMTGAPFGRVVRPGSTSMFAGLHLVNGYSPVSPAGIGRFLDFGTHGQINPAKAIEVVMPESGPDGLLARLGIDGIIVAREFEVPVGLPAEWTLAWSEWEGDVYHRLHPLPHVRALPDEHFGSADVRIVENVRQRVLADITPRDGSRPVLVTFSRPYFPGYRAALNGDPLPVTSLQGLAPTVEIPAGARGRLELIYRPRCVTLGAPVALATLAAGLVALIFLRRKQGVHVAECLRQECR